MSQYQANVEFVSELMEKWVRQQQVPAAQRSQQLSQSEELRRLKAELKRVTEERDILKKRRRTSLASPTEVTWVRAVAGIALPSCCAIKASKPKEAMANDRVHGAVLLLSWHRTCLNNNLQ